MIQPWVGSYPCIFKFFDETTVVFDLDVNSRRGLDYIAGSHGV